MALLPPCSNHNWHFLSKSTPIMQRSESQHSFSILQPDLCGNLNRLTGWMAVLGAFCLAQISLALRKLSRERNSVLLRLILSAIKLPAGELIRDYGMSATWHECTAKLTKAIGISWPRVKKNTCPSPSALSFWGFGPSQTFTSFPSGV